MKLNPLTIKKFIELAIKSILVIGFVLLYFYSTVKIHGKDFFEKFVFDNTPPHLWLLIFFFLNVLFFGSLMLEILNKIEKEIKKKKIKKNLQPIIRGYFIMEKSFKVVIKLVLGISLYSLIIQLYSLGISEEAPVDNTKIKIWIYLFLSILFLGIFVLLILFFIKKKIKKPKTKKKIQITIYGFYVLWACGFFYTRLHPDPFWNRNLHKTKILVKMIHKELETEKSFLTIYKENKEKLKHFDVIDVNTKSAGNFRFPEKKNQIESIKNKPKKRTYWSERHEIFEFFNPKTKLKIYQKRDSDSVFGSMGKKIDGEVSIFIYYGTLKCIFYTEKTNGHLNCIDTL